MTLSSPTHPWNLTAQEAIELQKKLRQSVVLTPLDKQIKVIAGCDVSMNLYSKTVFAGFVLLSFPDLAPLSHAVVKDEVTFPYILGLLSFREIPSLLKVWDLLKTKPDVIIADGVGIAHPRRFGIASHLGVLLDIPTIGCAKSVLTGTYDEPEEEAGLYSYLYDRNNKTEVIGAALRTKHKVKPVFISPGHKITLEDSINLIKACVRKHRLPEPTRLAHNIVNEYRKKNEGSQPHSL